MHSGPDVVRLGQGKGHEHLFSWGGGYLKRKARGGGRGGRGVGETLESQARWQHHVDLPWSRSMVAQVFKVFSLVVLSGELDRIQSPGLWSVTKRDWSPSPFSGL